MKIQIDKTKYCPNDCIHIFVGANCPETIIKDFEAVVHLYNEEQIKKQELDKPASKELIAKKLGELFVKYSKVLLTLPPEGKEAQRIEKLLGVILDSLMYTLGAK